MTGFACGNGDKKLAGAIEAPTTSTGANESTTSTHAPAATQPPATTASTSSPATEATWVKVATLSSTTKKQGPPFQLLGGQQRVTYSCLGDGTGCFWDVIGPDLGCHSVAKAGVTDETQCYLEAGEYHLETNGFGFTTITVKLEELR